MFENLAELMQQQPPYVWAAIALALTLAFFALFLFRRRQKAIPAAKLPQEEKIIAAPAQKPEAAEQAQEFAPKPNDVDEIRALDSSTWLNRLNVGLSKTRKQMFERISDIFQSGQKLDAQKLEDLH